MLQAAAKTEQGKRKWSCIMLKLTGHELCQQVNIMPPNPTPINDSEQYSPWWPGCRPKFTTTAKVKLVLVTEASNKTDFHSFTVVRNAHDEQIIKLSSFHICPLVLRTASTGQHVELDNSRFPGSVQCVLLWKTMQAKQKQKQAVHLMMGELRTPMIRTDSSWCLCEKTPIYCHHFRCSCI